MNFAICVAVPLMETLHGNQSKLLSEVTEEIFVMRKCANLTKFNYNECNIELDPISRFSLYVSGIKMKRWFYNWVYIHKHELFSTADIQL